MMARIFPYAGLQYMSYEQYKKVWMSLCLSCVLTILFKHFVWEGGGGGGEVSAVHT